MGYKRVLAYESEAPIRPVVLPKNVSILDSSMRLHRPYSIMYLLGFNGNRVILADRTDLFRIRHNRSVTIALAEIAVDLFGG